MNMNELFGAAGSKPKLITAYTSGTGTYVPTVDMARCLVRIQGAGGGGASATFGGGGGAMTEWLIRIPIAGLAYTVGAGGAVNATGSQSKLGPYTAMGGIYVSGGNNVGGPAGWLSGGTDADGASILASGVQGVSGGGGGHASATGNCAGFPVHANLTNMQGLTSNLGSPTNGRGNGSGGNSFYGEGGTTGNSPAAGNYGGGGGVNAAGLGGYIEIWDFGA